MEVVEWKLKNLEAEDGLCVAKEEDSGIGLSNESERLEEEAKTTKSENGELDTSVMEASADGEGYFSIDSLCTPPI
ncbi:hypothetical protein SLA2020_047830 [Shorea laevis]